MQAVTLIEPGIRSDAVEEEGIEQQVILGREVGIDRLEIEIGRASCRERV